jgi:hypothetical protein
MPKAQYNALLKINLIFGVSMDLITRITHQFDDSASVKQRAVEVLAAPISNAVEMLVTALAMVVQLPTANTLLLNF